MVKLLGTKNYLRMERRWLKRVIFASCLLSLAALIFYLVFQSNFFTIKVVNCSVKDKTSLADEKRWCGEAERLLLGQRIFRTHLDAVADEIEHKFLPVGNVVIKRKYPQTVAVEISERKPLVKVAQPGGREYLLDKEGVLYSEVVPGIGDLRLVTLELGTDLGLGQKVGAEVVALVLLEESPVQAVKLVGQEMIEVRAGDGRVIFFSRQKNLTDQIRSLQTIMQKYRIEGKQLKSVDLRYDQPVVKY